MSADKPGLSHPDVNGFVIGRSIHDKTAKELPDQVAADPIPKYLPGGARRRALDVAKDQRIQFHPTAGGGDSPIDA